MFSLRHTAVRGLVLALALASLCSCGSRTTEDPPVPTRLLWSTGNCSIPDAGCIEYIEVGIYREECLVTVGEESGKWFLFRMERARCDAILAPVLADDTVAAVRRGSSCTGTPSRYFQLTYHDESSDKLDVNGCSGEPYDTIARVKKDLEDAVAHPADE